MEEDPSFLYVWKTYKDINSFFHYIDRNGVGKLKKESYKAVQNTINANQKDILYLFCLLVDAKLLVACLVKSFTKQINKEINKILNLYNLSFEGHDLNGPEYHDIKISWLLFLSQTVDFKGEELKEDFNYVPLGCAGELLNNVQGDLQDLANEMHEMILSSQKCG